MARTRDPIFKGKPSPCVRRMRQMSEQELQEHLRRLGDELAARDRVLERLEARGPSADPVRHRRLSEERERLDALIEEGRRLLQRRQGQ